MIVSAIFYISFKMLLISGLAGIFCEIFGNRMAGASAVCHGFLQRILDLEPGSASGVCCGLFDEA